REIYNHHDNRESQKVAPVLPVISVEPVSTETVIHIYNNNRESPKNGPLSQRPPSITVVSGMTTLMEGNPQSVVSGMTTASEKMHSVIPEGPPHVHNERVSPVAPSVALPIVLPDVLPAEPRQRVTHAHNNIMRDSEVGVAERTGHPDCNDENRVLVYNHSMEKIREEREREKQKEGEKIVESNREGGGEWEREFLTEPLKSVNLEELRLQRSPEEVAKLAKLMIEFKDLLSDGTLDFSNAGVVKHDTTCEIITTVDNPRIVSTARPTNPADYDQFAKMVDSKLNEGVIEPSKAPWSSNSILIKKDGKLRMVIDYRALNKVTVRDAYPMPRIQDITDTLGGTRWFTGVDCVQAFHQIPMADERSRDLTTFRGPAGGLFRYRYMPMGLVNAMAIWSRFIDKVMEKYHYH